MFPTLRNNFGNITFIYPLTAVMGWVMGASLWEILFCANQIWITTAILMMIDDIWPMKVSADSYLLTEEELVELDKVVSSFRITDW